MPRKLTAYDRERDSVWLDLVESRESTTAEIAAMAGLTQRQVQSRIKAAKERGQCDRSSPEVDDGPVLHLTHDPASESGDFYCLDSDRTSRDDVGGLVLLGNHHGTRLRRQRLGTGTRNEGQRNDKLPEADGLKGGTG